MYETEYTCINESEKSNFKKSYKLDVQCTFHKFENEFQQNLYEKNYAIMQSRYQ